MSSAKTNENSCEIQLVMWNLQQSVLYIFLSLIYWALHALYDSRSIMISSSPILPIWFYKEPMVKFLPAHHTGCRTSTQNSQLLPTHLWPKSQGIFLKHSDSTIFLPIPQKNSSPLNLPSEPSCIISSLWKCRHKTMVFLLKDREMDVQTCQVALILIKFFRVWFRFTQPN